MKKIMAFFCLAITLATSVLAADEFSDLEALLAKAQSAASVKDGETCKTCPQLTPKAKEFRAMYIDTLKILEPEMKTCMDKRLVTVSDKVKEVFGEKTSLTSGEKQIITVYDAFNLMEKEAQNELYSCLNTYFYHLETELGKKLGVDMSPKLPEGIKATEKK